MARAISAWSVLKKQARVPLVVALAACLLIALSCNQGAAANLDARDMVVRISPTTQSATAGSVVGVDILVTDCVDLYGADVRFSFNPSLVQAIDADPIASGVQVTLGPLLTQSTYFAIRKQADNTAGTVWVALTQLNPAPPVNGTGVLAHVDFQTLAAGSVPLAFISVDLVNQDGTSLLLTSQDETISILPLGGAMPTPSLSATATATSIQTPTATAIATPSATATSTHTSSPSVTPTVASTRTPTVPATATPSATATSTHTARPSVTPTVASTRTPTVSATATPATTGTSTHTPSPSVTPTVASTRTPTVPATATPSAKATGALTATPSWSATTTRTVSPSSTATATSLRAPSATSTLSPLSTPTPTRTTTVTATPSPSGTATRTGTRTVTATQLPSGTATRTGTRTVTATSSPSGTATRTGTHTVTATPSLTGTFTPTPGATGTPTPLDLLNHVYLPVIVSQRGGEPSPTPAETATHGTLSPTPTSPLAATPSASATAAAPGVAAVVPVADANWVAVDQVSNQVFVSSRGQGKVTYFDGNTLGQLGSITVGSLPFGLGADPTNRLLYVANYGSSSVSLISMDTHQVLATYLTGGEPTFVAVDPTAGNAFVPLHPGNQVARFSNGSYLGNFTVRGEQIFAVALDTGATPKRLYIGTRGWGGNVLVYDVSAASPAYITTLSVRGFVYSMAADSATGRLYVVHAVTNDNNVRFMTVFDRAGSKLSAQPLDVGVNTMDGGGVAAVAGSRNIYVAGTECITVADGPCAGYAAAGSVQVLSGSPLRVVASLGQSVIPAGPFGIAVDNSRGRVYVTSKGSGGWLSAINDAPRLAP